VNRPLLLQDGVALTGWRERMDAEGLKVGFVPTMGKLHEGHLALMRLALADPDCDRLLVSIYVNPTQFRPGEDFDGYPRQLAADLDLLAGLGVAACFAPDDELVYPPGNSTQVSVDWGRGKLCDRSRPGHFDGVVAVVARLFNLVRPHMAVFGQKDAQQALVLQRLVCDLHFPLRLRLSPTVREADGLAMSSRNSYLDPEQRERATTLYRSLEASGRSLAEGERDPSLLAAAGLAALNAEPGLEPEYFAVVDPDTLEPPERIPDSGKLLVACAARLGGARLIDNHVFSIGEDGIHETLLF
jgi:pantoate--beta-alanine ligase